MMPKIKPITLSSALGVMEKQILDAGVINVSLNCDTSLFIDPLLLKDASDKKFGRCAHEAFVKRFELIIRLLQASKADDDKAHRSARTQLSFPEIRFTHLGFSRGTKGAGFGKALTTDLVDSAKQVIELGTTDPDLFLALALFEENVGPDRIGDMTTNVIIECLSEFNERAARKLNLGVEEFRVGSKTLLFAPNPLNGEEPLILIPKDIVRRLPVAADWEAIRAAAKESEDYKKDVNNFIGQIWEAKTKEKKQRVRDSVLRSTDALGELLQLLRNAANEPYDVAADIAGEIYPSDLEEKVAKIFPLDLKRFGRRKLTLDEADDVVREIITHFQDLIENNGIWKEMWLDDLVTPRLEKAMQRMFFAVASAYCKSNNLDLSPEADAGVGPVDFKISDGGGTKVLVEIKRSRNSQLVNGYTEQLEAYKRAEKTTRAHYVIIDVGHLTSRKRNALKNAREISLAVDGIASQIWFVDGSVQMSASKRRA
jgi:hypothetical protein